MEAFEKEFAAWLGASHAVGVATGTDAIELALRLFDIGPGDIVFTTSHTAIATVAAIERAGAIPFLVDIDPNTYTISPALLEDSIRWCQTAHPQYRLKAVVPVHIYGHPVDMARLVDIARVHNLRVIEDCAQSHGAVFAGRNAGTLGDAAAFSCYPTKILGAFGDAGVVAVHSEQHAKRLRVLRQYGWETRDDSVAKGINSRLDPLQAAILRIRLLSLAEEARRRQEVADFYSAMCRSLGMQPPYVAENVTHAWHQYVIRVDRRDELRAFLGGEGVGTAIHYPCPIHLQPSMRDVLRHPEHGLPITERYAKEILSLPMHPYLTDEDLEGISKACGKAHEAGLLS